MRPGHLIAAAWVVFLVAFACVVGAACHRLGRRPAWAAALVQAAMYNSVKLHALREEYENAISR